MYFTWVELCILYGYNYPYGKTKGKNQKDSTFFSRGMPRFARTLRVEKAKGQHVLFEKVAQPSAFTFAFDFYQFAKEDLFL
jgi:hypothetical protein